MSQGREQRYSNASTMRAAMKGERGPTTAVERTEAATVLFPGPEVATLISAQPAPATAAVPGETTVVKPAAT